MCQSLQLTSAETFKVSQPREIPQQTWLKEKKTQENASLPSFHSPPAAFEVPN